MWHKKFILYILGLLICSSVARSTEIVLYSGVLSHSSIGGCCQNMGSKLGTGLLARINLNFIGDTEISAYSNKSFNVGQIAKSYYILGQANRVNKDNPQIYDPQMTIKYVSDWKWILSPGIGFFSHTTRTKNFDLPALVSGASLGITNHFVYSLGRSWSLSFSPQIIYTYSQSDQGLWLGASAGLGYEF